MHRAVLPAAARVALGVAEGDPLSVSKLSQAPVVADLLVLQPLLLQQGEAGPSSGGDGSSSLLQDTIRGLLQGQVIAVGEVIEVPHSGRYLHLSLIAATATTVTARGEEEHVVLGEATDQIFTATWDTRIRIDPATPTSGGGTTGPTLGGGVHALDGSAGGASSGTTQATTATDMVGGLQRQVSNADFR